MPAILASVIVKQSGKGGDDRVNRRRALLQARVTHPRHSRVTADSILVRSAVSNFKPRTRQVSGGDRGVWSS